MGKSVVKILGMEVWNIKKITMIILKTSTPLLKALTNWLASAVLVGCLYSFSCAPIITAKDVLAKSVLKKNQPDTSNFPFQSGDILFQDLDCGELCEAIEKVTHGMDGKSFSHIGLVFLRHDSVFVMEAIGKDVHLTPIEQFMGRSRDAAGHQKIVVGRLKTPFQHLHKKALQFAMAQIGTPYDNVFLYQNGKYYCSELIYDAYQYANHNQPFFQLEPMTFKDPATGKTFPAWVRYYEELKMPIPEGKPGCNPAGISRSDKIDIVKSFY